MVALQADAMKCVMEKALSDVMLQNGVIATYISQEVNGKEIKDGAAMRHYRRDLAT